jgi:arylsulfatase B
MLEALDTEIGRLMASMSNEERNNTVVMFIGDNGSPNQVTRGLYGDHQAKGTIYDSGTRLPLIVTGPGVKTGRTEAFVNSTDLYATIAALAGATVTARDSIDFSPVLSGAQGRRDYIYIEHFTNRETRGGGVYGWSFRLGSYKLVNPKDTAPELYDLAADPLEATDLLSNGISGAEAQVIASINAKYQAIR